MTQRFKPNDPREQQVIDLLETEIDSIGQDLDDFLAGAYICYLLGDVLYDTDRDPMTGVINKSLFRSSFFAIHELFTRPGTFEFYLEVFRAIFGTDAQIEFVVPGPGKLTINITALNYETFNLLAREIIDGSYQYFPLLTSDTGENILAQGYRGIYTEAEIQALVRELSPNGIYTVVDLIDD